MSLFLTTLSHPFGEGHYRIDEVARLTDYSITVRTYDLIHLKEHIFHLTSAKIQFNLFCVTTLYIHKYVTKKEYMIAGSRNL